MSRNVGSITGWRLNTIAHFSAGIQMRSIVNCDES
jgi:hypothetical protein